MCETTKTSTCSWCGRNAFLGKCSINQNVSDGFTKSSESGSQIKVINLRDVRILHRDVKVVGIERFTKLENQLAGTRYPGLMRIEPNASTIGHKQPQLMTRLQSDLAISMSKVVTFTVLLTPRISLYRRSSRSDCISL